MGIIKLKNPLLVNGESITEMAYDSNEITGALFATAEGKRKSAAGNNVSFTPAAEFDFTLHLYLGFAAIIAVNPSIDWSDLERIKGHDNVEIMKIGRNFMLGSEEDSPQSDSEEPTAIMVESTTQASLTYSESE